MRVVRRTNTRINMSEFRVDFFSLFRGCKGRKDSVSIKSPKVQESWLLLKDNIFPKSIRKKKSIPVFRKTSR